MSGAHAPHNICSVVVSPGRGDSNQFLRGCGIVYCPFFILNPAALPNDALLPMLSCGFVQLMKIGVIDHIDCAHFLPGHPKCGLLHGHTYKVELVIEGDVREGMVMDFADVKRSMREILIEYDHKSWNDFLDYPSVENICQLVHRQL